MMLQGTPLAQIRKRRGLSVVDAGMRGSGMVEEN
jgi:hypothetical protein